MRGRAALVRAVSRRATAAQCVWLCARDEPRTGDGAAALGCRFFSGTSRCPTGRRGAGFRRRWCQQSRRDLGRDAARRPEQQAGQQRLHRQRQPAVRRLHLRSALRLSQGAARLCGASPTYPQVRAFADLASDDQRRAFIDAEIDRCTATEFWRGKNGQLWKVAHPRFAPSDR